MYKIMGIDYGDARTGVAISDLMCGIVGSTCVVPSRNREKAIADMGHHPHPKGMAARMGMWMGMEMNTMIDNTSTHIEEMLIEGATMGIVGMTKAKNTFTEAGAHAQGIVFMHIPMVNWGVRALTYYLFGELSWNPDADVRALVDEYLERRYGRFAEGMRRVYERIEDASGDITSWRAWRHDSIIYKYMLWDGGIPKEPLPVDDHFGSPEGFEARGRAIRAALLEAKDLLRGIIREAKDGEPPACRNEKNTMHALLDDYRNLIYGIDVQHITLLIGCYYNALYAGDMARGDALFAEIEAEAEHLESYYMPATYSQSELKLTSKDAFTRSQCDGIVARCRQMRKTLNR